MRKIKKACFLIFLFASFAYADFQLRLMPDVYIPANSSFDISFEGNAAFDYSPFTVRGTDSIYFTAQGGFGAVRASGIQGISFFDGVLGAGYEYRPVDRVSVNAEAFVGLWNVLVNTEKNPEYDSGISGLLAGGRVGVNYFILPELSVGIFGGFKSFIYQPEPFFNPIEAGISLRYNLSRGVFGGPSVVPSYSETENIFPVFYSYYDDNPFGFIIFTNNAKNAITGVKVSVFIEKFMTTPKVVAEFDSIASGENFTVNLTAFLNESILNQILASKSEAKVMVEGKCLSKSVEYVEIVELQTLARNNMSWEEDERAAAFVSGKDAAANKFANIIRVIFRDRISSNAKDKNEQYARAIFAGLKAYGINYVIDPSSAFTENSGTTAVDFLQFPYQTILYHGGDCDDLTILNCSLMEALGIDTAMITVPGHIYMAYDSGYSVDEASKVSDGVYIKQDDKIWIPVEVTLCQDTYALAKSTAIKEWNKYPEERKLIPLKSAWSKYKPVNIPESDVDFEIPSRDKIIKNY